MPNPLSTQADSIALIRNEPVQARSAARLTALLDAAAVVVSEIGYERLTTAMVADRAGASIGTVYRYFPDRIAVLQSLSARNAERLTGRVIAELTNEQHSSWDEALSASFQIYVEALANEPGFASLRYGDVIDLRPATGPSAYSDLAEQMFAALASRFTMTDTPEARAAFEAAIVASDAIAAHAFRLNPEGDKRMLKLGFEISRTALAEYFG